jgi:type I restriction enzyme S subunit
MAGEWRELRVGDLVRQNALMVSDGYRVRNEELGPEGIPFVRGGDIGNGWINTDTEDHIRPECVDRVRAKLTQPGDAAFITKGTVGRGGAFDQKPPVVFAPQVAYWRVIDRNVLDPGFVFYLMQSHGFQSALNGVKTHGAMAADYRGPTGGWAPSVVPTVKLHRWVPEVKAAIEAMSDGPVKTAEQAAFRAGKVRGEIFEWPQ